MKMTSVGLQMISIGSLLILNDQTAAARAPKCITAAEVTRRFQRTPLEPKQVASHLHGRTCAQVASEMDGKLSHRSLSPWSYRLDRNVNRNPMDISFAECLCSGCIVNKSEDPNYNSVLVYSQKQVQWKTSCPHDPKKFVVRKALIPVPVACTCAVPRYK